MRPGSLAANESGTAARIGDVVERSQPQARHGGDLRGIINLLYSIAGMGFTQLWLDPALENNQPEASYGGHAITDFYNVRARWHRPWIRPCRRTASTAARS